jgi:hypothetical protein
VNIVETKIPNTEIERLAKSFTENVPEQDTYSREDYIISGSSMILSILRQLVNDHALDEPKSAYEQGLYDGLIWSWETVARLYVQDGDELERLLGTRTSK